MKREIALAAVTFVVAASGGFLLGRSFPAHHYEPWKNSNLLYDTATGKVCNPLKSSQQAAARAKLGGHADAPDLSEDQKPTGNPFYDIAAGVDATDPNAYIPSCN